MKKVKKDHPVGTGTGATGGALGGAILGAAAGPVGSAIGAVLGAVAGAEAGDALAEYVNPTEYDDYWREHHKQAEYYDSSRDWNDYAPAYGLGYHARGAYRGRKFDDVDSDLERAWDRTKGKSRLAWKDARSAVRDGWHHVERALPGDFDRDGR